MFLQWQAETLRCKDIQFGEAMPLSIVNYVSSRTKTSIHSISKAHHITFIYVTNLFAALFCNTSQSTKWLARKQFVYVRSLKRCVAIINPPGW